ncbi:MAG TPA: hypothetical protein VK849_05380 [Longimicrobiales bacterium]|nr:hypothetical protein [Longimicrobiales bacterium]
MYVMREVLRCRPGKVGTLLKKFEALNGVLARLGHPPFRMMTDVAGESFWTLVLESEAPTMEAFLEMEASVMSDPDARSAMEGYHELVEHGRREVFKLRS